MAKRERAKGSKPQGLDPSGPSSVSRFCEDDPIQIIYTPQAQYVICLGCLAMFQPVELLPMMHFVLLGKEFVRRHRFCKPTPFFSSKALADDRDERRQAIRFDLMRAETVEEREPGAEG
jgi:hypothetical protein